MLGIYWELVPAAVTKRLLATLVFQDVLILVFSSQYFPKDMKKKISCFMVEIMQKREEKIVGYPRFASFFTGEQACK